MLDNWMLEVIITILFNLIAKTCQLYEKLLNYMYNMHIILSQKA